MVNFLYNCSLDVLDFAGLLDGSFFSSFDVRVFELFQRLESEQWGVNAEPQKGWWWAIEVDSSKMGLALGAFASFVVLLLVIGLDSGVVYIVEVNFRILLFDDFDSVFNASPESRESGLWLVFSVKGKQPGITDNTMVESDLIFCPEHASKRSFHGFGFNEESLMWGEFQSLCLIRCFGKDVINNMRFSYGFVNTAGFKVLVFTNLVNDWEALTIYYPVH